MNTKKTPSRVLLVSKGIFHPPLLGRFWLARLLRKSHGQRLRVTGRIEALESISPSAYSAVVLYYHRPSISPAALDALENFNRSGGGILAIHSASASFNDSPGYFELLGGRFDHHGPVQEFQVDPTETRGGFFNSIGNFSVRDELYRHEWDSGNQVHFATWIGEQMEPVVWTRVNQLGRVCYLSLGHTSQTMRQPDVQKIIERGLAWVSAGGDSERRPHG